MKLWLKNLLFTIVIPGSAGGYIPYWLGTRQASEAARWHWTGLPLLCLGAVILLVCIIDFGSVGKGTPFPLDPPENLVTSRLYRFSRNPMYVGVLTAIAGWTLWFGSIWILGYFFAVAVLFNLFIRRVEEPSLKNQFGEAYETYCRKVPRWF